MAKATKSDAGDKTAPKKKEPAAAKKTLAAKEPVAAAATTKKAPAGKRSAKSAKPPSATGSGAASTAPRIDTGLAAAAAASMIANRAVAGLGSGASQGGGAGAQDPAAKPESSAFKSFKEGLSKPPVGGLGAILGAGGGSKKFNQGFGGPKPSVPGGAKNQTFGADVNRAGVPRRTGG